MLVVYLPMYARAPEAFHCVGATAAADNNEGAVVRKLGTDKLDEFLDEYRTLCARMNDMRKCFGPLRQRRCGHDFQRKLFDFTSFLGRCILERPKP